MNIQQWFKSLFALGSWKAEARQASSKIFLLSLGFFIIAGAATIGFSTLTGSFQQREIALAFSSNSSQETGNERTCSTDSVHVYQNVQPQYARTALGKDRIQLVNNEKAIDPAWQHLMMFLLTDKTDLHAYDSLSYPCGAYAQDIHNNAEATGIKAAWVVVKFEDNNIKHALNAFHTTDRGWVWIDCTQLWPSSLTQTGAQGYSYSQDKMAYVSLGEEYALINMTLDANFEYSAYEAYKERLFEYENKSSIYYQKTAEYILESNEYEEWMSSIQIQSSVADAGEIHHAREWYEQLQKEKVILDVLRSDIEETRAAIGVIWGTLGRVVSVEIYW